MALKSKFSKKNEIFKANKIFTDRKEPRAVFAEAVAGIVAAQDEEHSRQIVSFYGKGGIGKTSLLKQLMEESEKAVYELYPKVRFHNISINLEAYEYANPVNVLTAIRSMIDGDGSLFDYALMQYYAKARVSMEEIKNKNSFLSSPLIGVINEAIGVCTASASIPQALLEKSVELIKDVHFRVKYKDEIEEIKNLNEFEIFERLPYYLGLCISNSAEKGVIHVLFVDSFETLCARTAGMVSSVDNSAWFQELFLSCEKTLFVVGSRDRIDWEKKDEEWSLYLDQHFLSNLSDEDCRWFLEQVPVADAQGKLHQEAIAEIIRHAGGVPLYLDLCVDLYENAVNNGKTMDFSHFNGSAAIIDRYMRHLKEKDQHAVCVLAMLKSFDLEFADLLLQKRRLDYQMDELDKLLEKSIFLPLEGSKGLWKVDESVRRHIYEQMMPKWRATLMVEVLDTVLERRNGSDYSYFSSVISTIVKEPDHIGYVESLQEKLFETMEYFSGIGYWNENSLLLRHSVESENPGLSALACFAELIWLRRTGNLSEAAAFALAHPQEKENMGVWHYGYCFLQTHIQHLLGNYDESLRRYRELLEEMELVRQLIPNHVYGMVAIKYADLQLLKGNFPEALDRAEKLLADPDTTLADVIELMRIKGHVYRFQRKFREAKLIYEAAMKLAAEHNLRAFEGKLYTNMTEVNCLTEPETALKWYEKAMEVNTIMSNEIEIGKAQAAGSVALTTIGQTDRGEQMAHSALLTADNTGYQSGRAFAMLALAYAQKQAGKQGQMEKTLEQVQALLQKLRVYHYLLP